MNQTQINSLKQVKSYQEYKDINPEVLIGNQLTDKQHSQVAEFIRVNHRVFAINPQAPEVSKGIPVKIPTGGAKPIKLPPYRANPNKAIEIKKKVETMLKDGVIEETKSPWSSPVVLVQKKDGTTRFCIDYRKLNDITTKDSFPVPRVDDTLDALGNADAKIFSTMDLASGYWQLKIDDDDKEKTAFVTQNGTYQFRVMPFGLTGAPGAFCRVMNSTMSDLLWKCCLVFVDDIVVWSKSYQQHFIDLQQVFDKLIEAGFTLKASKCKFFYDRIEFLGYVIEPGIIRTDPVKVKPIQEFNAPRTKPELQRFLGMIGWYRRFIQDFSRIAKPLFELLKKETTITDWKIHEEGTDQNKAFVELKERLIKAPILHLPDWNKPFTVITDGSKYGIAGVLTQITDGVEHPIAYYSASTTQGQRKWTSQYKFETYAVFKSL